MIIDHLVFNVSDLERSRAWYAAALEPLRIVEIVSFDGRTVGFGKDGKPELWLRVGGIDDKVHVALSATRAEVDAFYAAALAAGGTDNGAPGEREIYHPGYYGAYVLDPDGHNIEAVSHS